MALSSVVMSWIIIWVAVFSSVAESYCPSVCSCMWKNGKKTAECAGQGLTVIPSELDEATQVIDLSRNNFFKLASRIFQIKKLVNLQKIRIAECSISEIAHDAFFQLSNLVDLDLSSNMLTRVPTISLRDCPLLRRLLLAKNPIKEIKEGMLAALSHLTVLDLSNCTIEFLQPGAFSGLKSLEVLHLESNQLSVLSVDVVVSLKNLYGIYLHNNPWICDCRVRNIREWMDEENIPLNVPPHCANPIQVKGLTWDVMTLDDFACAPTIISTSSTDVSVIGGNNATVICQVDAIPKASIFWEVGGRHLTNLSSVPEYKSKYNVETDNSGIYQISRLTIINVGDPNGDTYVCVAENKAGNASMNYTLTILTADALNGSWSNAQLTFVLIGVFLAVAIVVAIICVLIFHPVAVSRGTKVSGMSVLKHLTTKKQDVVEMNDVANDKEEKEFKAMEKQPRHETGSSGYGSDQLTPDLVSKIVDVNNGPSLSTSTVSCNHPESDNVTMSENYGPMGEHWNANKMRPPKYDESPGRNPLYSEIYSNPCYGKGEDADCYLVKSPSLHQHQTSDYPHAERCVPQNDRVRTLRGGFECSGSSTPTEGVRDDLYINSSGHNSNTAWKRSPLSIANNVSHSHYTLPTKARFSPDEGYAEEGLEGTEV